MNGLNVILLAASLACVYGANIDVSKCGGVMCMMYCPFGNVMDNNGCPLCKCNSAPTAHKDNPCQPVMCDIYCPNGLLTGSDGCDTCQCNSEPFLVS